ncbi:P-II family nitrogen regulator [Methanobacterium sp.]|uniref:P-II family nitrogen regulator n=1 Tax=Methanobacterium sp. TaxID=2164 RepID=UPI003C70A120
MIKILILGASGSGKTTGLKYIENNGNVSISPFDYGKAAIGENTTYLFSSPGMEGFKFINDIISHDIDGIIVFIDNTIGATETDEEIINFVSNKQIPYVIFANKQDLDSSNLKINSDAMIIPTIAVEGIGINDGLRMLLKLVGNTVKQDISQENEYINISRSTKDQNITPKREFKDIIKDIKLSREKDSQKPDFREIVKKIKPLSNKYVERAEICKLKLIMHPIELDNVKKALEDYGFSNITLTEVGYLNKESSGKETYRGSRYNINIPQKVQLSMILKREDVKYVIQAIEPIKTEDIVNNIFISPIENVIRIRTEERGEEAIE